MTTKDDMHRLRVDIATTTRLLVRENILDYAGHVSARLPGRDQLMIQSRGDSRAELEPEALLVVDFDGRVVSGEAKPPSELAIHTEIYRARSDVGAVLHCHMDIAIHFTLMEDERLVPMRARAARWAGGIPVHPDPSHIKSTAQGSELVETLGAAHAVLMRAHGMVLIAESVRGLFVDAVHFKENAIAQMQVLQAGRKPKPLSLEEIDQINRLETRSWHVRKLWNFYVREGLRDGRLNTGWGLAEEGSPKFEDNRT